MTEILPPRLAIHVGNFAAEGAADWPSLIRKAEAADRSGIDKLIVSDHVVLGERLDEYARPEIGGISGGQQPTSPDGDWLEPITLLSYLAARTTQVRLATHVLLAALRRPIVLAKSLATLDVLSGGRLDIGVGVGWQREEYEAAGLNFDERGQLLDECLHICQTVWRQRVATISPAGIPVDRIHQMPKPLQSGGVPVWVGGRVSNRTANRLARFGSGWIPWGSDALDMEKSVPRMRQLVYDAGRDPRQLRIVGKIATATGHNGAPDIEASMARVGEHFALGVTDFVCRIPTSDETSPVEEAYSQWAIEFDRRVDRTP